MGVFWVFAVAVLTIYIVHNIKYATSGRALLAVREDGIASESVGVSTTRYKVTAFVIGAALAGVAGGLFSHHKSLVTPSSFRFMRSIEIVAMVILGGQGSITGAVLAAIILTLVPEVLRSWVPPSIVDANTMEKWRMVFYSLFIILSMLFMPRGLFGRYEISDLFKWFVRLILRRPGVDFYGGSLGPLMVWAGLPTGLGNARGELPPGVATLITEKEAEWEAGTDGPLLQVSHVCMQFGGLRAVDDFNLELRHGELVGLIGPNGAGKTTAFNVLTGVYRPTAGEIRFAGRSIAGRRPHVISNRGIARTFQNIRVFGNLSVLDNVQIAQHAHHRLGRSDVHVGEGFVEQQKFGVVQEAAGEREALPHALGILADAALQCGIQADGANGAAALRHRRTWFAMNEKFGRCRPQRLTIRILHPWNHP